MTTETIRIAHIPEDLPIYVACFRDVKNAGFLREQLLAANQVYNYAFIDAATITSRRHILAAAFRALNDYVHDRLKSNNIHSELVFCLSPNSNIGEAFRRFGIQDMTKDLVVIKAGISPETTQESVQNHLHTAIEGTQVAFDDGLFEQVCDFDRVRKTYKLAKPKGQKAINGDAGHSLNEREETEVQVLGLMALRGAT